MPADFAALRALEAELKLQPNIVTWSRLEPLSLSRGDLTPGLQAPLADPLWLLGRQWQLAELHGEDAGSPIAATVAGETAPVSRFRPGPPALPSEGLDTPGLPIEVVVEAETGALLPEHLRAAGGQHLLRLLGAAALPTTILAAVRTAVIAGFAFPSPDAALLASDPQGGARRHVLAGRVPDAARLAAATGAALREVTESAGEHEETVRALLAAWRDWWDGLLARPVGLSWDPHRQEYAFAVQATLSDGPVVLRAEEYGGGTLDWHAFDAVESPDLGSPVDPGTRPLSATMLPTQVRYPGMPTDRFWEFEDTKVYLGGLTAGPTDLVRLALAEFALVFGNDWFLVPVDLPYGHVVRIDHLEVRDTFGVPVTVRPARQAAGQAGRGWTTFGLTDDDSGRLADVFFLPATVRNPLEGEPLEEIALFRDEMANLVWGVERVVQGPTGAPLDRRRQVRRSVLRDLTPQGGAEPALIYRLMTPVPENWIPFVAVPAAGRPAGSLATELERRPMVQLLPGEQPTLVHPTGRLLRSSPDVDVATDRLRLAEEEVPRDGVVVTRRFQLARMAGGGSVMWLGRAKATGRGEGSSGLRFDTAVPQRD